MKVVFLISCILISVSSCKNNLKKEGGPLAPPIDWYEDSSDCILKDPKLYRIDTLKKNN